MSDWGQSIILSFRFNFEFDSFFISLELGFDCNSVTLEFQLPTFASQFLGI